MPALGELALLRGRPGDAAERLEWVVLEGRLPTNGSYGQLFLWE